MTDSVAKRNFFVIGAQKAGTTALHNYLSGHPQLSLSRRKELHFFDNDGLDWSNPPYGRLEDGMGRPSRLVCGEATPITMFWPNSIERLYAYDPNAKLIVMLRHPAFRAHSHWRMIRVRKQEEMAFSEAIREGRKRVDASDPSTLRRFTYVERGFYGKQLDRVLKHFDRSQLLVLTMEQLRCETDSALRRIELFLGVDAWLEGDGRHVIPGKAGSGETMSTEDRHYLHGLFENDIRHTIERIGIDISGWLNPDYEEPVRGDGGSGRNAVSGAPVTP